MHNDEPSIGARIVRVFVLLAGIAGGLAALDALALFLFLVLAGAFVQPPNAYVGLLLFVLLPVAAVFGAALAWGAYAFLRDKSAAPAVDHHEVQA